MTHGVGTTCWLAPELIKDNTGTETIDVYAFGIVLWELATREEVYHNLSAAQIISRVANEGLRPPLPAECPWRDVMAACWAEDPLDRPSFAAIFAALSRLHEDLTGAPAEAAGSPVRGPRDPRGGRLRTVLRLHGVLRFTVLYFYVGLLLSLRWLTE